MVSNTAAWITALSTPFEVKPAILGTPGENQILIKNHAIAINPIDGKIQYTALYPLTFPTILGEDVAGEVVATGPSVTRFKKGDRVAGFAVGASTKREQEMAFQSHTILQTNMASPIPDNIPFANAVVLGLGLSTAADALFNPEFLALQLPTAPAQKATGKTLLVWGGASSVGSNAIQLAVAAGYEVITTASPKNFEYVKRLGAGSAFDYNSPTVITDLVDAFRGRSSVGAFDAIGAVAWAPTLEVVRNTDGVKVVATVAWGFPDPPGGIVMKKVFAPSCKDNHVGKAVWEDFLPAALEAGSFVPAPEPLVAGRGLESLQGAVDMVRRGVSARKVVVLL
ncbi:zinc-binding oxidoreductase CipB [Mytilinidion resinicola]|uniref:Zinc-binding oxidoreductase CipB n=1 Tax=Mytilinidion resinicola TaxID=574789 RepID=A0A6A6YMK4_9PEZI|nr:zinc-binding oxidoreductase CipB [Mytilinidion resinicola]KAF2809789.1 zinc-binding oxidoreductase CipB [Mytilinidion resinicola]